jgi:hypothetical protein
MNANDYGSLPNKKTSTDSGLYGNGSVYSRPQQTQGYPYQPNFLCSARKDGMVNSYQIMQSTSRPCLRFRYIEWLATEVTPPGTGYSGYQPPQNSRRVNDSVLSAIRRSAELPHYYSAAKQRVCKRCDRKRKRIEHRYKS